MYINTKGIKRYEGIDEIYVENIDETFTETIKIVKSEELAVIVYLDLDYTELNQTSVNPLLLGGGYKRAIESSFDIAM